MTKPFDLEKAKATMTAQTRLGLPVRPTIVQPVYDFRSVHSIQILGEILVKKRAATRFNDVLIILCLVTFPTLWILIQILRRHL